MRKLDTFEDGSEYMRKEVVQLMKHLQTTAHDEAEVGLFEVIKGVVESIPAIPKQE